MLKHLLAIIVAGIFLSGCSIQNEAFGPPIYKIYEMPQEEARTHLAGKTIMTFVDVHSDCNIHQVGQYYYPVCNESRGPGTLVEYLHPNGLTYLWAPGRPKLVKGRWIVRRWREKYEICFIHEAPVRRFARGRDEGVLSCNLLSNYAETIIEIRQEDSFNLSGKGMPFALERSQTTFDTLLLKVQR